MKRYILFSIIAFATVALSAQEESKVAPEQPVVSLDTLRYNLRMRELTRRRDQLEQRIKEEDSRRGAIIVNGTPAEQEAADLEQDSLCLSLRSELVDVNLAIDELTAQGPSAADAPAVTLPNAGTTPLPVHPTTGGRPNLQQIIQSAGKVKQEK